MRGQDQQTEGFVSDCGAGARVPPDHPLCGYRRSKGKGGRKGRFCSQPASAGGGRRGGQAPGGG